MGVRTHFSAYLCGHTTCRGRGTVTHQSESAHQTSQWTGLCRMLHTYFAGFPFHTLRGIKGLDGYLRKPRQLPRNARAERRLAESMLRTKSGQQSRTMGPQLNLAEIDKS